MEHNTTPSNNKVAFCNNCREVYQQAQESRYVTASQCWAGNSYTRSWKPWQYKCWSLSHILKKIPKDKYVFIFLKWKHLVNPSAGI